jgi:pyruvate dehydrogenase E2 component (dihydrolipoamide acetyltransferase)
MSDPTITVSSLGDRGVEALYGIIYPPQVAIVGIGKAVTRP